MVMIARVQLLKVWYVPVYAGYGCGYEVLGICTRQSYILPMQLHPRVSADVHNTGGDTGPSLEL